MSVIIGVDPRKATHTAVAISSGDEQELGRKRVRSGGQQAEHLLAWAAPFEGRTWAIESAGGLGYLLAQQLVAAGEDVVDVPATLASRVRVLATGRSNKNDPNDAVSVAIAALRSPGLRRVEAVGTTFQRARMIEGFLRDVLACPPPWDRAAELLTVPKSIWTPGDVQDWLDGYVDRRNRIAHDGDRRPSGTAEPIQRYYVETAVRVVHGVVDGVQDVIETHVARGAADPSCPLSVDSPHRHLAVDIANTCVQSDLVRSARWRRLLEAVGCGRRGRHGVHSAVVPATRVLHDRGTAHRGRSGLCPRQRRR